MALPDLATSLSVAVGEVAGRLHLPGLAARPGVSGVTGWPGVLADLPEPRNDPDDVRHLADDILSRPEYRDPPEGLIERIQNAISDFLGRVLSQIGLGSSGAASWLAWLVLAVMVAVVAVLIAWLVMQVTGTGWGSGKANGGEGDPIILDVDEHRSPREWLSEAERHESEGRWREGLLCRYRALVTELIDRKVIAEAAGRTAGEYLSDVRRRHPADAGSFVAATGLFEEAWYGGTETGAAERDRFVELAGQVLATLAGPPVAAGAVVAGEGPA
jgi:hypothetical protein